MKLSIVQQLLNCCAHNAMLHCRFLRHSVELVCVRMSCVAEQKIILSSTCLITANSCWDSKISNQHCPLTFHFRLDKKTTPTFDTVTDIKTDLVNDECVVTDGSMLYSVPGFCLVHTADSCANEWRFSCDQVPILMCSVCLLAKQVKTTFSV